MTRARWTPNQGGSQFLKTKAAVLAIISPTEAGWIWTVGAVSGTAPSRYAAQRAVRRALKQQTEVQDG